MSRARPTSGPIWALAGRRRRLPTDVRVAEVASRTGAERKGPAAEQRRPARQAGRRAASLRELALVAATVELCFLALTAVAPVGGVSQTISPLARAWPWLLAPARLVFGRLATLSIPPAQ